MKVISFGVNVFSEGTFCAGNGKESIDHSSISIFSFSSIIHANWILLIVLNGVR